MKKEMKNILRAGAMIITIFWVCGFVMADKLWESTTIEEMTDEIKKIEEFYKNTSAYSIKVTHKTFKNYTTDAAEDQASGYFIKDSKNNYHSFAMGIHTIQNSKIKISVDSLNSSIYVNEPDKSFTKEVKVSELKDLLKACSAVKRNILDGSRKFRFEFKNGTYSAYEIWANSSYQIKKLVIYFSTELNVDPDDEKSAKTKPRAEIVFSDYKTGITPDYKKYFDEAKYVVLKNGEYMATGKYSGYIVYDLRVKN